MAERISAHLEEVLAQTTKGGEEFFTIQKRIARTENEANLSQNDLDNIKHRIIAFIKDGIKKVNWYDPAAVNKFCTDLDAELIQVSKRFIKAHNRIEEGSGREKWTALTEWLKEIRNKTKDEIFAEIDRLEQTTAPAVTTPAVRPPKKAVPEPLTLGQRREKVFIDILEQARSHGVPEELGQALAMYTLKLSARFTDAEKRSGEEAKAVNEAEELLKTIMDLIAKLAQERDDAEELTHLTDDEKTTLIKELKPQIAQLQADLEAANAKIATHEQEKEEESVAFEQMRDSVIAKEESSGKEIAKLKTSLKEALAAKDKQTGMNEELKRRLAEAEERMRENARREQVNRATAERNNEAIERHLALLVKQTAQLKEQTNEITAWLNKIRSEKRKTIVRRLGPTRNPLARSIRQALEEHIDSVLYLIKTAELAPREAELRRWQDISTYLLLLKGSGQPIALPTPQFEKFALPTLLSLEVIIDEFLKKSPHEIK